jgi:membrane-associated PAP2 superfamily phosphatase
LTDGKILVALIAALGVALIVFAAWPGLDLAVSHAFHADGRFVGDTHLGRWGREFFRITPYALLIAMLVAFALKRLGVALPCAPGGRSALFLLATMVIGPGLIVNLGMKDHLHRPRPVHVQEFGGEAAFKPWYAFDGACDRNCAFASGEAAQGFWMVAPALLAPLPWRPVAVAAALAFGFAASLLRLAFGGHFLSDVTVGGLIALIVVFGLKRALWPRGGP